MKKIFWWVGGAIIVLIGIGSLGSSQAQPVPASTSITTPEATTAADVEGVNSATPVPSPAIAVSTPIPLPSPTATLSNDNYYTNSDGNAVHAPAYSSTVPLGATAQCKDGTYSFSQHRSGTCSDHGGVAVWL